MVNIGTPNWNRDVLDNDFLQEVHDWIEYCNGPTGTHYADQRAANADQVPVGGVAVVYQADAETG